MKYFGAILSKKYHTHQQERLKASHKAFYGLQGSGMCANRVRPEVVSHLWKAMIQPILYATQTLPLSKSDIVEMDKLQAKLIKSALGFTKYYRTTPLLNAMNVNKIANLRNILKSMFFSISQAIEFYNCLMNSSYAFKNDSLMSRAHFVCFSENVSFILYLLNDNYHDMNRKRMKIIYIHGNDGLTDTVGQLLQRFALYDREILKLLLLPF